MPVRKSPTDYRKNRSRYNSVRCLVFFLSAVIDKPISNARSLPIFGGALVLIAIIVSQVKIFNTKAKKPAE